MPGLYARWTTGTHDLTALCADVAEMVRACAIEVVRVTRFQNITFCIDCDLEATADHDAPLFSGVAERTN